MEDIKWKSRIYHLKSVFMDIQYIMAVLGGKLTAFFMKVLRRGGTTLPGLVAETIDKNVLKKTRLYLQKGIILITGTNGKTTIANILANTLKQKNYSLLHNSAGSNLKRGIISAILKNINLKGKLKSEIDFGIFECDEAALIEIALSLNPQIILFNNLFRDQLDRYGEVETIRKRWISLIQNFKKDTKIILNADDPGVKSLGDYMQNKENIFYFGLCNNQKYLKGNNTYYITDFKRCPMCGKELVYNERYFSHLGNYFCKNCGFKKPSLDVCIKNIHKSEFEIFYNNKKEQVKIPLSGLFNVYNFLAALAVSLNVGIDFNIIKKGIESFNPIFGRQEEIDFQNKKLVVSLVKNPVGFTEVLKTFSQENEKKDIVILLNDNIADGTDVSWIWDVDLSIMKDKVKNIIIGGTRFYDMGLRLKYEEIGDFTQFIFCSNLKCVFDNIKNKGDIIYIFLTYTALLDFKKYLAKLGYKNFWEK